MCSIHVRGITIEQMDQLVEMTRFFYADEDTHIYQDPDFLDNIVIASTKGDNYNTTGWFQICFDLILPKVIDDLEKALNVGLTDRTDIIGAFMEETSVRKLHPVDLLYSPYLAIKEEQNAINTAREATTSENKKSKT